MKRTFAISTLGSLGLSLTTGCSPDNLVGSWDLVSVDFAGKKSIELSYSYTEDGCTYTYSVGVTMDFERGEGNAYAGLWTSSYNYTNSCQPSESYSDSESYNIVATSDNKRDYTIKLEGDLGLSCQREDDELVCNPVPTDPDAAEAYADYYSGLKYYFER